MEQNMNRKSFIYRLAKEKPIMLYADRIYELTNSSNSKDFFLSISGIKKIFTESEPIVKRETMQYQANLDTLVSEEDNKIKKRKQT